MCLIYIFLSADRVWTRVGPTAAASKEDRSASAAVCQLYNHRTLEKNMLFFCGQYNKILRLIVGWVNTVSRGQLLARYNQFSFRHTNFTVIQRTPTKLTRNLKTQSIKKYYRICLSSKLGKVGSPQECKGLINSRIFSHFPSLMC